MKNSIHRIATTAFFYAIGTSITAARTVLLPVAVTSRRRQTDVRDGGEGPALALRAGLPLIGVQWPLFGSRRPSDDRAMWNARFAPSRSRDPTAKPLTVAS
jgi:hypothetical protein